MAVPPRSRSAMLNSAMARSRTILALSLAARKQGVTAAQLAKEAGLSPRTAQELLLSLLGDHGDLGVITRERILPYQLKSSQLYCVNHRPPLERETVDQGDLEGVEKEVHEVENDENSGSV